jgi:hypothetical protein
MRGRVYDPKTGRFLTTDPIVSEPLWGQRWNPYSYTVNNPLSLVDPSGFSEEPAERAQLLPGPQTQRGPDGALEIVVVGTKKETKGPTAAEVGAEAPPTDVDTTGSSSGYEPQPVTTGPEDWTQHSLVQVEGGLIAGLALGRVPFGSVVAGAIAGPGSRWAEIGRGVGEIVGGGFAFTAGVAGMLGGGAASGTGVLTLPGVAAVVGSAALVAGGIANVKAGAERLGQALAMSSGSGSSGPPGKAPTAAGGTSWSKRRSDYWKSRAKNAEEGQFSPENLERMRRGKPPLDDDLGVPKELHHKVPRREGGGHTPDNLEEVWPWEHEEIDPFRHYKGPRPSGE